MRCLSLVEASDRGGDIQLRSVPNDEPDLSPMEIWCNEAQERYVLAILPESLPQFTALAERERCPFAVVGQATKATQLSVYDEQFDNKPVDLPTQMLFDDMPRMACESAHILLEQPVFDTSTIELHEAIERVLQFPLCGK